MGKGIHDQIRVYLSKLKKKSNTHNDWMLSSCNYPRTPSFAGAGRRDHVQQIDGGNDNSTTTPRAATLSDVDRFLCENFSSLYGDAKLSPASSSDDAPVVIREVSSRRFFVDPSTSSSIVEDGRSENSSSSPSIVSGTDERRPEGVAVVTLSRNPYDDFRRSMAEMVEAKEGGKKIRQPLDWDFLEDLLFCFLRLNDRTVHKYILGAFTDLTVDLRQRSGKHNKGKREI